MKGLKKNGERTGNKSVDTLWVHVKGSSCMEVVVVSMSMADML